MSRLCNKLSKACPGKQMPSGFQHQDEQWVPVFDPESA